MYEQEFLDMALSKGFHIGDVIIADGSYRRFDIKPGDKAGYYNLDTEGHGVVGNWKTKEQFLFRSGLVEQMTEAERREHEAKFKQQMKQRREVVANKQNKAALEANKIWDEASPAIEHAYLKRKKIKPHGARIDKSGTLIIPIYEHGKIVNLQRILSDGRKLFLPGGKKKGCYSLIDGETDTVVIAEGFATAASINEATGKLCIVALDAGNILPVAKAIREKYGKDVEIIIGADNDQWSGEINIGIQSAQKAAEVIYASVKYPRFDQNDPDKYTDWNDFANVLGLDALRDELLPQCAEIITQEMNGHEIIGSEVVKYKKANGVLDLELDPNGNPKATIANLKMVCDEYDVLLRYNVIKKQEEILLKDESFSVDNALNASYAKVVSLCKEEGLSIVSIKDYLTYLTDKNPFNPVTAWIRHKPWDNKSRLQEFYDTIESPQLHLKEIILKRWMLSAIAAVFNPNGISAHGVLVFRGEQYLGKTSWFKRLVPSDLDVIKDGYILRLDNKDSIFQCLSHWLVELGELEATFRKSDIAQLKAFITADRDIMRRPYAAKESCYARRTVFFASVNQREFLFDETGNRRFWTIETSKINYNHTIDMQQVWAEFYEMYRAGEGWIMLPEEMGDVNINNEEFMGPDYHDELVQRKFNWDNLGSNAQWKTATEVAQLVGIQNPKQTDLNRLSKALKKYNGDKYKRGLGGVRLLLVPKDNVVSHIDYEDQNKASEFI